MGSSILLTFLRCTQCRASKKAIIGLHRIAKEKLLLLENIKNKDFKDLFETFFC